MLDTDSQDIPRLSDEVDSPTDWRDVQLRGSIAELQSYKGDECLVDGPAGSGKSYGICVYLVQCAVKYPGLRILMSRKTRHSMTETILPTFESVLDLFGLQGVHSNKQRNHRDSYLFPNGSVVVITGLDDRERIKSSDYGMAYLNEATEATEDDWLIITTRLRQTVKGEYLMGYCQGVCDCNPGPPTHWLLARVRDSGMARFISTHKENPVLFKLERMPDGTLQGSWTAVGVAYIAKLDKLTGVVKKRMRHGQWVSAEGAVFEAHWNPTKHMVEPVMVPDIPELRSMWVGVDWGSRDPGVFNLMGFDAYERAYRIRGIYRTGMSPYWWVLQAKRMMLEFPMIQGFVCDNSSKGYIQMFQESGIPAIPCDKSPGHSVGSIVFGIRLIEQRLANQPDGQPGLYFVKGSTGWYDDSGYTEGGFQADHTPPDGPAVGVNEDRWAEHHQHMEVLPVSAPVPVNVLGEWVAQVDPVLKARNYPCTTEDEFYVYAYPTLEPGKPVPKTRQENPIDMHNHGMDTLRYVLRYCQGEYHGSESGLTLPESDRELYEPYVDETLDSMI